MRRGFEIVGASSVCRGGADSSHNLLRITGCMSTKKPKSIDDPNPWRLTYLILPSGHCVLGTSGNASFGAFHSAGGAAWWLRKFADSIEADEKERIQKGRDS